MTIKIIGWLLFGFGGGFTLGSWLISRGAEIIWSDAAVSMYPPKWFTRACRKAMQRLAEREQEESETSGD